MLPHFFRHYDSFVDRYFIYDDGSADGSAAILRAHPRTEVRTFQRSIADSFVLSEQSLSNSCWKASRGAADWTIVTDIDEFLFHPGGASYFARCKEQGVTLIPALGFQMLSAAALTPETNLLRDCAKGAPWVQMMKPSVFNPDAIDEIHFAPGRHSAAPQGRIVVPGEDELLLFHYKYLGLAQTQRRHKALRHGLGGTDLAQGWGHKYSWSGAELRADWERFAALAFDTVQWRSNPARVYPIAPWWENYRNPGP